MITLSKKIRIMRKDTVSDYMVANHKVIGDSGTPKIGGSVSAESAMLVCTEELASYLPNILGVSPNSPEWLKNVDNYVRSISVPVPVNGYEIEIGFIFDETDINVKDNIKLYRKDNDLVDAKFDEVVEHICKEIHRNFWWKYGRPISPADFYLWRYCQGYKKVANQIKDADNKSLGIRFYLLDEDDVRNEQLKTFTIKNKANKMYQLISDDIVKVKGVLFLLEMGNSVLNARTNEDLLILLDAAKDANPVAFTRAATNVDKHKDQIFIEECIARNIFTRVAHSTMIIDVSTGQSIGGNMAETVAYLKDTANAKYRNTIEGLLNSKTK